MSDDLGTGLSVMGRSEAISALLTIVGSEGRDANGSSHIDLVGDRSSSDVKPVGGVRSKVLSAAGLDELGPLGDLEFARLLEVGRECGDELSGGNVLDGDAMSGVNKSKCGLD